MVSQTSPTTPAATLATATAAPPLDVREIERCLLPFGESRMLPRAAYTAPEVFVWEERYFFEDGWTCVGTANALPRPGDQRAVSIGQGGVFLMRGEDAQVRAFANACRHRGHELLPCGADPVNRAIVICPYHAWSYRLDGGLRHAPGYEGSDHFDAGDHGLVELDCAEWHGLLFVNAARPANAPASSTAFADHVAGLDEIVAPYELERLVTQARHEYVVAANWKVLNENYQECYHCPMIHPELCSASPPKSGENYQHPAQGAWAGGWMELRDGYATMSLDGRSGAGPLRGLDHHRRRIVDYVAIFPNVLVSLHPDYVMTHVLTPLAADRTKIVCEWHFAPEDAAADGFDPAFAVDFWDVTNRQDWLACESVQRGLSSPHAVPGPLAAEEDGVHQFVTMVAAGYLGKPVRPAAYEASLEPSAG